MCAPAPHRREPQQLLDRRRDALWIIQQHGAGRPGAAMASKSPSMPVTVPLPLVTMVNVNASMDSVLAWLSAPTPRLPGGRWRRRGGLGAASLDQPGRSRPSSSRPRPVRRWWRCQPRSPPRWPGSTRRIASNPRVTDSAPPPSTGKRLNSSVTMSPPPLAQLSSRQRRTCAPWPDGFDLLA